MLLELLFPRKCILCQELLPRNVRDLCHGCRTDTPEYRHGKRKVPFIQDITAVWAYEGPVRKSLHRYKFSGRRNYAPAYGRLVGMRILRDFPEAEVITWVPVSARRLRERGYDQVELLAKAVSRELNIPAVKLLDKFRDNRPNSSLKTPEERRANVLGVYRVKNGDALRDKRVLLLDDILTTGATASECARVLLTAGAKEVYFAAVAARGK